MSSSLIREADNYTIENEPISSFDLMERAASNCTDEILKLHSGKSFTIFAGIGNNGGDGLVIYRLLKQKNIPVNCYLVKFGSKLSEDCQKNADILKEKQFELITIDKEEQIDQIHCNDIIIDALLGVGTDRPLRGLLEKLAKFINQQSNKILSVDMTTGLYSDFSNHETDTIIKANEVYTFEYPKLGLFLSPNSDYFDKINIVKIGLLKEYINSLKIDTFYFDEKAASFVLKKPKNSNHKGSFGHLALISGSEGMIGATVLSAKSAMRSGVGKCTVFCPSVGRDVLQIAVPEVMVNDAFGEVLLRKDNQDLSQFDAIAIGPGIGQHQETESFLLSLLEKLKSPTVIDADALNIIAKNKAIDKIPSNSVLTPHPNEFERLFGTTKNREETISLQQEMAKKHQLVIVLKGRFTTTALTDGRVFINSTGNYGMATAGSGDVLTGIIGGLLAQGYLTEEAATLGVYLHGYAGDKAAKTISKKAMIASDIIDGMKDGCH